MAMLEEDREELLQRRLEEKIKSNVETKLFRYYRNVGSTIIAVLGLLGAVIGWPKLQFEIESEIKTQIAKQVKQPVEEAKAVAANAKEKAEESHTTVRISLESIKEKQTTITNTLGKLDVASDDLSRTFAKVNAQIDKLNSNAEELRQKIDTFNEQFKFNLATQNDINAINKDISTLAVQSKSIASALRRIEGAEDEASRQITSSLDKVAGQAKERSESASNTKSTIYVQFAGGRREHIKLVTAILRERGWLVPSEERLSTAANRKEIRYFHREDENSANRLMKATNEALGEIGFGTTKVTISDFTHFQKPPRPGVLELWLEIPLRY